ncbi:MAG: hypothetical protein ACRDH2_00350, partial [Anaerolineales bacterium]
MRVSRRAFLKASGLAFSAALLPPTPPDEAPRPIFDLGRTTRTINVYDRPSFQADVVVLVGADTVFKIYSTVLSQEASYNPAWYQVRRGYVYSGHVQPVRWQLQTPSLEAPAEGFLGEITVPYSISKTWRNANAAWVYRLYYGTTYWMAAAEKDEEGRIWYQVYDERLGQYSWVVGEHVRRVSKEEVAPLSPNVRDKRIEINLEKQTFQCFENGAKVLDTLCSTGIY